MALFYGRALSSAHAVPVPHEYPVRTDRAVRSFRVHRPFPVAQVTPRGVDFAGAPHGTACFVRPNVGAPLERLVRPHPQVHRLTRRCLASCPAAWAFRSALPAVAWQDFKPPCLNSCTRGQCWSRRPNELANDNSCLRSAVLRFSKVAPSNFVSASRRFLFRLELPSSRGARADLARHISSAQGSSSLSSTCQQTLICWRTALLLL